VELRADVPMDVVTGVVTADFSVRAGERRAFVLVWHPSYQEVPPRIDPWDAAKSTTRFWREWTARCTYRGEWREAVVRSLITLKALTYRPTGGIVAAPTTSLPEDLGGSRNWDYRFCWLRDATFTLYSLLQAGYEQEAEAWREWLLRAVAGDPRDLRIMYGIAGERRIPEMVLEWLPGYEESLPVRVGNDASRQFQLDVYGEVLDLLHQASREGLPHEAVAWDMEQRIADVLESQWREPDEGIWEVRGGRRHFTHSKVMAWVGIDRAIRDVELFGFPGPVERWRTVRDEIHDEVCREAFDEDLGAFTQSYGSKELDAATLMIPLVGFLPAHDPRTIGTVQAIRDRLMVDGFVRRYDATSEVDGLPGGEGAFLPCTCWLADCLALQGHPEDARELFERVLEVRNDVGLLAEEYDPVAKRLVGNFPQAFSHVSLIGTARNLSTNVVGPAERRRRFARRSKGNGGGRRR
ncbi:MAG: glycoside hydrolase family 15 protein, partial [Actinomycetota bacterium]